MQKSNIINLSNHCELQHSRLNRAVTTWPADILLENKTINMYSTGKNTYMN